MRTMWLMVGVVAVLMVVFMWATSQASQRNLPIWEEHLFYDIYNLPYILAPIFLVITMLGSTWMVLAVTAVAWLARKKRLALFIILTAAVAYGIVQLGKVLIARPRPEQLLPDVTAREPFVSGFGYPSAHAAIAMVIGLAILPYIAKRYRWLVVAGILFVGISRVYLGVHFPLDVLGGFLIGGMIGGLLYLPHRRKVGKPKWLYRKVDF